MKYNSPYGSSDPNAPYVDRDTPGAIAGSIPPARAIEDPQREIGHVIDFFLGTGANFSAQSAADMQQLRKAIQAATAAGSSVSISTALQNFVIVTDQKANGVNGGDFLAGAWRTRDLNTVVADPNGLVGAGAVTLSANRFTLEAGTWVIEASAPAVAVNSHKTRLQNITDGTTAIWGTTEQTTQNTNSDQIATRSQLAGRVVLATAKTFELQHIGEQSSTGFNPGIGFGIGSVYIGGSVPEVYSIVEIRKVG